ncbi:hypothetical protein MA16_Dca018233 [Dendrobium catenatum]|uniref:Uncharacterized protein n=1 Tax=Dendrobium catenatum TaxID=906689 RepID=A0A2I0XB18_9ASPA|nr:hypothetical protein MA16_Dca018233 [Dendrobium catenatum]
MATAGHGINVVGEWQNFGDERPFLGYLSSTWFMQRGDHRGENGPVFLGR